MNQVIPRLNRSQKATWVKVTQALVEWAQHVGKKDVHMKMLLDKHDPVRVLKIVPCENDCGNVRRIDDSVLLITNERKNKRNHVFCSVECQRQNVQTIKARYHREFNN
jgi:hypothetical protein